MLVLKVKEKQNVFPIQNSTSWGFVSYPLCPAVCPHHWRRLLRGALSEGMQPAWRAESIRVGSATY